MIPFFSLKKKQFFLPLHMNSERRLLMFISIVCVCGYICNGRTKKVVFHSITFLVVIVVVLCIWISGTHVKTSISCVFQLSSNDTIRQNERNRKKNLNRTYQKPIACACVLSIEEDRMTPKACFVCIYGTQALN